MSDIPGLVRSAAPDAIIHTAGSYGRKGESWVDLLNANVQYGLALITGALSSGKEQIALINTSSALDSAVSAYALTKNQFSEWGKFAANNCPQNFKFIDVRLQHMFGPYDDTSKFSSFILNKCLNNEPSIPLTRGDQRRDFIYIRDVVSAYLKILDGIETLNYFEEIDVGLGDAPPVRIFVEMVHRLTKSQSQLEFGAIPIRPQEPTLCVADTTRLRQIGWEPVYDVETGLKETIEKELKK